MCSRPREDDPQRVADFRKYVDAMGNNFPNLLRILSTREKRNHFKVEGISKPDGVAFADLRMIGIGDDLATTAVETVLRKLLRAFYYKHTGTILPKDADVAVRWVPNAYFHTLAEPEFAWVFKALPHGKTPRTLRKRAATILLPNSVARASIGREGT
jgi:hypothetical protein